MGMLVFVRVFFRPMESHLDALALASATPGGTSVELQGTGLLATLYALLQLFTLNAPVLEAVPLPTSLQVARVLAPGIGVLSIILGLNQLLRSTLRSVFVRRYRGHRVHCYDEPRALAWARARSIAGWNRTPPRTILLVPRLGVEARRELRALGVTPLVTPLPDPRRGRFANSISGAEYVIVDLMDDIRTLEFAMAAREVGTHRTGFPRRPPSSVQALVDEPALELALHDMEQQDCAGTRLTVRSRARLLARETILTDDTRRSGRGPLHLALVGGGPQTSELLNAIVAVLEPGEEATVTLVITPETEVPRLPDELAGHIRIERELVEGMASVVHDVAHSLRSDQNRSDLGSPILVHCPDPMQAVLVAAGLRSLQDIGQRIAIVPPSRGADEAIGTQTLHGLLYADALGGSLRVVNVDDVERLARLDGLGRIRAISSELSKAIRAWDHEDVCGPHPAVALLDLLGHPRPDQSMSFPEDAVEAILVSLESSGFRLVGMTQGHRPSSPGRLSAIVDKIALDLKLDFLTEPANLRSRRALDGRTTLAELTSLLITRIATRCDLMFIAKAELTEPVWFDESWLAPTARAIHELYRKALPDHDRSRASDAPWGDLAEVFRESNLAQARRIPVKVAALGLDIEKISDRSSSAAGWPGGTAPSPEQLDVLGAYEHRRWAGDLFARGYRQGTERNHERRVHVDLIPYNKLDEETQQKDRDTIEWLPQVLEEAGLRLTCRDPATTLMA